MFGALFYNIKYSSKYLLVNTEDFTYTREAVLIKRQEMYAAELKMLKL